MSTKLRGVPGGAAGQTTAVEGRNSLRRCARETESCFLPALTTMLRILLARWE